jgi:hypothetical protein
LIDPRGPCRLILEVLVRVKITDPGRSHFGRAGRGN